MSVQLHPDNIRNLIMQGAVFIAILLSWIQLSQGGCKTVCHFYASNYITTTFHPEHVQPSLCEFLIIGYGYVVNSDNPRIAMHERVADFLSRISSYKKENPNLKVLLEVRSSRWSFEETFYKMLSSASSRVKFADSAKKFVLDNKFDGINIREETVDRLFKNFKTEFLSLMQLVAARIKSERNLYMFASLVDTNKVHELDVNNDIQGLCRLADMVIVETSYFYLDPGEKHGRTSRLYSKSETDTKSVDYVTKLVLSRGCPKEKLVISVSTGVWCYQNLGKDRKGEEEYLRWAVVSYDKLCPFLNTGVKVQRLSDNGPYVMGEKLDYLNPVFDGDFIYYYEDDISLKAKIDYAKQKGLAGIMFWDIWYDDFKGACNRGKFPFLNLIHRECS
uniref:GH18 domain-containing protein n=1 Tax=Biomphalaria glabrata TaxID=6526 RepID=A0A2C9M3E6_BIOGL